MFLRQFLFICTLSCLRTVRAGPNITSLLAAVKWSSPETSVAYPTSEDFLNATERWTTFEAPTYVAAITPGDEADVINAVLFARSNDYPFLATGGHHGFGITYGELVNGLAIDLSRLNQVQVDISEKTLTIGGGVLTRQIFDSVYNAGFEIQTGSCDCPGMIGATLGAGIGRHQGLHGLLIDALLSARMVTADGRVVNVSKDSQPDLLWAVKGAGANFGIITSATYSVAPLINDGLALSGDFAFPASKSRDYFDAMQKLGETMPAELSVITLITYDNNTSQPQILANWVYVGPEEQGREVLEPIISLGPSVANLTMIPWNNLVAEAGFGLDAAFCVAGATRSTYSATTRNLSASTWQSILENMTTYYEETPDGRSSSVEIEVFARQAVLEIPDDDTAYPWRDARGHIMFQFTWEDDSTAASSNELGRELRDATAAVGGYDGLAVYVSYAHGDETLEEIYGANKLERLLSLKEIWDPENVFRYNNALLRY
ncbi:FAD-binding domain-containing protein [Whalleya microplaca]|nr:FAD-binding domain-containing protein [Whalleya microplaca]